MTNPAMPGVRPANPNFSSGPCSKRPGWSLDALKGAALGRSHRADIGKAKLKQAIGVAADDPINLSGRHRPALVDGLDDGSVEALIPTAARQIVPHLLFVA